MNTVIGILLIAAIIVSILCIIYDSRTIEQFTVPARDINAAILFAAFKLNEHDYKFIERWHKDIDFYVVVNGEPTEWDDRVIELIGKDRYMKRSNEGYDTFAWKEGILQWKPQLSEYDLVALVNNSCIYAFDLIDLFTKADGYDMYGVYQHSSHPNLIYAMVTVNQRFLHSYFIIIGKRLFTSNDFAEYWDSIKKIRGHLDAVVKHEKRFATNFERLGYRIGVYECNIRRDWIHHDDKRPDNGHYHREFIKNKAVKRRPSMFDRFKRNMGNKYLKITSYDN